jgi:hypothetical protein
LPCAAQRLRRQPRSTTRPSLAGRSC